MFLIRKLHRLDASVMMHARYKKPYGSTTLFVSEYSQSTARAESCLERASLYTASDKANISPERRLGQNYSWH